MGLDLRTVGKCGSAGARMAFFRASKSPARAPGLAEVATALSQPGGQRKVDCGGGP